MISRALWVVINSDISYAKVMSFDDDPHLYNRLFKLRTFAGVK